MKQPFHFLFAINEQAEWTVDLLTPGTLQLINHVFCILINYLIDKTPQKS